MPGSGDWVQQVPLQAVPDQLSLTIADLGFAGRYVPAGSGPEPVAGDFYDVLGLGPDLIGIVVGDVVGHGPAALARMLQLRAAARAYAIEQPGPASVITRLDRFCARLDPESIATLWYGEYEPSTGTLTYASAGHPPPVLHADGETRLLPRASSPPLGVTTEAEAADLADVVVHGEVLPVGAVLVAYSDGLVERPDADFELQLAILQETVATACHPSRLGGAAAIAERIMETLVPQPDAAVDDVCLLVVRREATRVIEL